jgi:hypothetical protein
MLPTINLLHGRSDQLRKERELYAKVQFGTGIFLALYVALMVGVVAVKAVVQADQSKVIEGIKTETLALAKLQTVEEKYVLLNNKLKILTDYLRSRGKAREFLYRIYQALPVGVSLSGVVVGEDEKTIAITAKAENMKVINDYLVLIKNETASGQYRQISLDGLARSADGSYNINAEYTLTE